MYTYVYAKKAVLERFILVDFQVLNGQSRPIRIVSKGHCPLSTLMSHRKYMYIHNYDVFLFLGLF